jgi:hypothetical protein
VRRLCRRAYRPDCRIFLDLSRPWRPHYRQGFQRLRHLVVLGPFFATYNNARDILPVVGVDIARRFTPAPSKGRRGLRVPFLSAAKELLDFPVLLSLTYGKLTDRHFSSVDR